MIAAIPFPEFDPVAFTIPLVFVELPIRWYALAYIAGLVLGWRYIVLLTRRDRLWAGGKSPLDPALADDIFLLMAIGVVAGGRIGFVLFYKPEMLWTLGETSVLGIPLPQALEIWKGGMAFHGGLLGVVVAAYFYSRRMGVPLLSLGDTLAASAPFGIFFGRIANFVNGELWGRPTEVSWGMVFPQVQQLAPFYPGLLIDGRNVPRHPSQLYEAGLEGLLLALILGWLVWRAGALKRPGLCVGTFFAGYGLARFTAEFWRQYDPFLGFDVEILGVGFTRGQTLCLPMIAVGVWLILHVLRRPPMAGETETRAGSETA